MKSPRDDDDEPIRVFVEKKAKVFLIWNLEDVKRLRTKHRIVGELVGTLVGHKSQNDYLGLPLQLSVEEVSLGCLYGFLELVTWKDSREKQVSPQLVPERLKKKKRNYSEMSVSDSPLEEPAENLGASQKFRRVIGHFCKNAVSNLFHSLQSLWDWKRTWHNNISRKSLKQTYLEGEFVPVVQTDSTGRGTQSLDWNPKEVILVEEPKDIDSVVVLFRKGMRYPDFLSSFGFHSFASRRLTVFHDLWKRGFYISSGVKFGADFLAYADDPILFHASLAVVVAEQDSKISPRDLVAFGRLGVSTKKRATLAYIDSVKNGEGFPQVVYISIRWNESLP
ncbi:tRNA-splicing endonuclease subunit Sen34 [Galdieria sulphuraria]|uniref:tRNA-splicing endonuclease subunit Sen34 n=1 Tax=Galdieria sulphuraria TaxID=130081 RepID=M2VTG9_GALSU|nr:tRNA-intron endonuclease [Galdieria sulphuraria]EME26496.1 tRNA-intron endonuclease [Galdieria sulphuraria]GJD10024.1 tRNA-splicing endonuclease subunit Sen34 [Galdieria sulphuraria]|eukprot:XP_005703016.1 tRNA-intron endonuclease [Galdieria sulphuraria]